MVSQAVTKGQMLMWAACPDSMDIGVEIKFVSAAGRTEMLFNESERVSSLKVPPLSPCAPTPPAARSPAARALARGQSLACVPVRFCPGLTAFLLSPRAALALRTRPSWP